MEDRTEIVNYIRKYLAKILGLAQDDLTEETTLASLNMKSVNYSQLTTALEDACDVEVPYMEFKRQADTIGAAADYVVTLLEV